MDLLTPLETICRLIIRARELEAQVPSIENDDEEDPTDSDDEFAVLEDEANEAIEEEMVALLDDLGDDQVQELLALAWVGPWHVRRHRMGRRTRRGGRSGFRGSRGSASRYADACRLFGCGPRGVRPQLRGYRPDRLEGGSFAV